MSAILSADDLNDFISPGVACIKPVEILPKEEPSNPYEVTTEDRVQAQNPAPASISLTDCLACSGCVTSAEAVLVSLQSHTEVLSTLDAHPSFDVAKPYGNRRDLGRRDVSQDHDAKLFVASVSPQVRANLAATYGISERRAGYMIEQFLSGSQGLRIGGQHGSYFSYVVDTNQMREACLVLAADEVAESLADKSKTRPILTSACPGWICYAEKTHPHVLPHLSRLKSPQAMTGTLLKSILSTTLHIHPSKIWHLAIMPCFDKKLEASREELTNRWWQAASEAESATHPVRDVDCVITARELVSLASTRGIQLADLPLKPIPRSQISPFPDVKTSHFLFQPRRGQSPSQTPDSGTSGGYLYHILMSQQSLYPGSTISAQKGRNADVIEYTLLSSSGLPLLKCARYYGFRNIQNLVRKLKPSRPSKLPGAAVKRSFASTTRPQEQPGGMEHAYVEVMACPGGCTNGGGQIKAQDVQGILPQMRDEQLSMFDNKPAAGVPQNQREWLKTVDEAYFSADSEMDTDSYTDSGSGSDNESHGQSDERCYDDDGDRAVKLTHMETGSAYGVGNRNGTGSWNSRQASGEVIDAAVAPTSAIGLVNGIDSARVRDLLQHWSSLVGVPLDKLCYTSYRKVESDVGKKYGRGASKNQNNMSDSQRIAAIAGLQGGGW